MGKAVRNMLTNTVCTKEDVKDVVKSYAEVTEQSQKKALQHAATAQSSKAVVETVVLGNLTLTKLSGKRDDQMLLFSVLLSPAKTPLLTKRKQRAKSSVSVF